MVGGEQTNKIRNHNSKDRHYNVQENKKTDNGQHNTTEKTNVWATQPHLKTVLIISMSSSITKLLIHFSKHVSSLVFADVWFLFTPPPPSPLQLLVGGCMSYLCYFCCKHVLTLWETSQESYKEQELLTLREHQGSSQVLVGSVLLIFFVVFFFLLFVLFVFVPCLMYLKLPVFQDCPFLIPLSVFSNVY